MPRSVAAHQSLQRTTWTPWLRKGGPQPGHGAAGDVRAAGGLRHLRMRGTRLDAAYRFAMFQTGLPLLQISMLLEILDFLTEMAAGNSTTGFKGDLATPHPRRDLFIFGPTPRWDANWGVGSPARRTRCSWRAIRRAVPRGCHKNSVRRYMRGTSSVTWVAKAHIKLTFERTARKPHRRRFARI